MEQSVHRWASLVIAVVTIFFVNVICVFRAESATLELRGSGTLPSITTPPVGIPGEEITVSVTLESDDFLYLNVANPIIHYFVPTTTIPVDIVGSVSGTYSDISPIGRFIALELEDSASQGDLIGLDVVAGSAGTSLFTLSTQGESGFDGSVTPTTPTELFSLFANAMDDNGMWQQSNSSAVFVGTGGDLLFLGDLDWTVINPDVGDWDADGDVDGRDFLLWQREPTAGELTQWQENYGAGVVNPDFVPSADFDADGDVDGRDFLMWQRDPTVGVLNEWQASYGADSLVVGNNISVPEPAGLILAIISFCSVVSCRRR